jgi:hypothetical protein
VAEEKSSLPSHGAADNTAVEIKNPETNRPKCFNALQILEINRDPFADPI